VATVDTCYECDGALQHNETMYTNAPGTWKVTVRGDKICVELENASETNLSVNVWLEDQQTSSAISDSNHWVTVAPWDKVSQCFTDFGYRDDQVTTPIEECTLHTALYNMDDPNQGAQIWMRVH
jgi:hypothetical protein